MEQRIRHDDRLMIPLEVLIASELPARPEAVWSRVASFEGVNDELRPWLRMTAPLRGAAAMSAFVY
jgi:hypothetical protein